MKISVIAIGKPGKLLAGAIAEYERRAARYWTVQSVDVREERATAGRTDDQIRAAESRRLEERVPDGAELVVLTRTGRPWSSMELTRYLESLAVLGRPGAAFVIGGALGLDDEIHRKARHQLSLSAVTLPHDMARLILLEQIYRAGTILRGEPYHKATE